MDVFTKWIIFKNLQVIKDQLDDKHVRQIHQKNPKFIQREQKKDICGVFIKARGVSVDHLQMDDFSMIHTRSIFSSLRHIFGWSLDVHQSLPSNRCSHVWSN